jgi:membrane fusion protein, multidrug efflux system
VIAPTGGRAGLRQVDAGNMVHATDANGIVLITEVQPVNVVFPVPQDQLQRVLARLAGGAGAAGKAAGRAPVLAYDRDGRTPLAAGTLLTADNQVDATTGTVKLKAEFPNTDNALFPNQFVNIKLVLQTRPDALTVPSAGVQRGAPGLFAYVVRDDGTVAMRPLKLGATDGDRVEVLEGLAAGERVVTEGTDRLREGARVEVVDPAATRGNAAGGNGRSGRAGERKAGARKRQDGQAADPADAKRAAAPADASAAGGPPAGGPPPGAPP